MRPKKLTYTLADLDADGFCNDVTGDISATAWTTIEGSPDDGCAHQTTLTSSADLSAITITVTGTDAEDRVQSESIAGPNNTTKNMTKYFKTVTSVSSNATLGANTMDVGWTALCCTPAYPLAVYTGAAVVSVYPSATTVTMQQTVSPIFDTANYSVVWQTLELDPSTIGESGTDPGIAQVLEGATAIRGLVSDHTSGVLIIDIAQSR